MAATHPPGLTRELILNTAAALFADKGVDAVSIRSINAAAGLSPGILHYHFGSKNKLVEELIGAYMVRISTERQQRLETLQRQPQPTGRDIAAALIMPLANYVRANPEYGSYYVKLVARLYSDRSPLLESASQRYAAASIAMFPSLLQRAFPWVDEQQALMRMGFANQLLLQAAIEWLEPPRNWQIDSLARISMAEKVDELVQFLATGFGAKVTVNK